jgi:hypothetical protein
VRIRFGGPAAAGTELDRALKVLDDGERVVAETGARGFLPELLYARARVHAASGEHEARRETLLRGLRVSPTPILTKQPTNKGAGVKQ